MQQAGLEMTMPVMPQFVKPVSIGKGRKTLFSVHKAAWKSHAGKPAGYVRKNFPKHMR